MHPIVFPYWSLRALVQCYTERRAGRRAGPISFVIATNVLYLCALLIIVGMLSPFADTVTAQSNGGSLIPQGQMSVVSVSSDEANKENVLDGNSNTKWGPRDSNPHEMILALGGTYNVSEFRYTPYIWTKCTQYEVYVSATNGSWGSAVVTGTWATNSSEKTVSFPPTPGAFLRIRYLNSYCYAAEHNVAGVAATNQPPVGVPTPYDLNGDGKTDIVWRNTTTGDVAGWLGNGLTLGQTGVIAAGLDSAWIIKGMGDLDGDGKADIVWRNTTTGDVAGWLGNGLTLGQTGVIATVMDLAWVIEGVGDLDGDGKADIVWHHTVTGDVAGWLGNGLTLGQTGVIASSVPLEWEIQP